MRADRKTLLSILKMSFSRKEQIMKENKLLPVISLIISIISLLDNFLIFISYGHTYLSIIAIILAILSFFYNQQSRKDLSWIALGISLVSLAVTIYFYYHPIVIPY